eukprot:c8266_g1_i1 orf=224-445(-)
MVKKSFSMQHRPQVLLFESGFSFATIIGTPKLHKWVSPFPNITSVDGSIRARATLIYAPMISRQKLAMIVDLW